MRETDRVTKREKVCGWEREAKLTLKESGERVCSFTLLIQESYYQNNVFLIVHRHGTTEESWCHHSRHHLHQAHRQWCLVYGLSRNCCDRSLWTLQCGSGCSEHATASEAANRLSQTKMHWLILNNQYGVMSRWILTKSYPRLADRKAPFGFKIGPKLTSNKSCKDDL